MKVSFCHKFDLNNSKSLFFHFRKFIFLILQFELINSTLNFHIWCFFFKYSFISDGPIRCPSIWFAERYLLTERQFPFLSPKITKLVIRSRSFLSWSNPIFIQNSCYFILSQINVYFINASSFLSSMHLSACLITFQIIITKQ